MKKLSDFSILKEKVFYRGWHILEYIETHKELTELDKNAIKATIMEALVSSKEIDPSREYLNFDNLCITNDKKDDTYSYEKHPNISGIPLWMKELFRTKSIYITGGLPVSVFLSIPSKSRCIYDMNTSVSAFFEKCTFYTVNYKSPTRLGVIALDRPFVEIEIDGVLYLVDNITRRIIRRDFFERNYGFDIKNSISKEDITEDKKVIYDEHISKHINMSPYLSCYYCFSEDFRKSKEAAEHEYEIEMSKKYFPNAWEDYKRYMEEMNKLMHEDFFLVKK